MHVFGEASVKMTIVALPHAPHGHKFVTITLMLHGEGAKTQSADTTSAKEVWFSRAAKSSHL